MFEDKRKQSSPCKKEESKEGPEHLTGYQQRDPRTRNRNWNKPSPMCTDREGGEVCDEVTNKARSQFLETGTNISFRWFWASKYGPTFFTFPSLGHPCFQSLKQHTACGWRVSGLSKWVLEEYKGKCKRNHSNCPKLSHRWKTRKAWSKLLLESTPADWKQPLEIDLSHESHCWQEWFPTGVITEGAAASSWNGNNCWGWHNKNPCHGALLGTASSFTLSKPFQFRDPWLTLFCHMITSGRKWSYSSI